MSDDLFKDFIGHSVVVRSGRSGVWHGKLVSILPDGSCVSLARARRAWSWAGATECVGLAIHGPRGGKITVEAASVVVRDVLEIIIATHDATERWLATQAWVIL
jgi:hypothetical protein